MTDKNARSPSDKMAGSLSTSGGGIKHWEHVVVAIVNTFVVGVKDSLSFHKTIPVLVNCQPVAYFTGQVLAANILLLVGSVLIFNKGISPAIAYMTAGEHQGNFSMASHVAYAFYHANWIVPILILCYVVSMTWYQELADAAYRHLKGRCNAGV
jgi:hypothetical protein